MAFSDARNERERAEGTKGSKSSGGGGDRARQAEARNREAMSRGRSKGGGRHTTSSSVAADHLVAIGKARTKSIPSTGVATGKFATQDDAYDAFSKAVGRHAVRGTFGRIMDTILGGFYDEPEPMAGNPRSFAGGDWHSRTNVGGVLGGVAGMFAGPFAPVVGKLASLGYDASGLPQAWHGGFDQPDIRTGPLGNSDLPQGATMADIRGGFLGIGERDFSYPSGTSPAPQMAGNPARTNPFAKTGRRMDTLFSDFPAAPTMRQGSTLQDTLRLLRMTSFLGI